MAKIKYKELSPEMIRLAQPASQEYGRASMGLQEQVGEYYFFPIDKIKPYKYQARRRFCEEELQQLANTIKEVGVRQPISIISSDEQGFYEVVSGERRLRAAQMASLKTIPCLIIKDKEHAEELSLIENIQREDLHPVELGDAYSRILSNKKHGDLKEFAEKIGKNRSMISECCKLSFLPEEIKSYLIQKNIRSKPLLRRLTKISSVDEMRIILGIGAGQKKSFSKNIMRISFEEGIFKLESSLIKTLSAEEKHNLKNILQEIIEDL